MIKILIVEDEKPISDLMVMNLTRAGYKCTALYNGRDAADLLEENQTPLGEFYDFDDNKTPLGAFDETDSANRNPDTGVASPAAMGAAAVASMALAIKARKRKK